MFLKPKNVYWEVAMRGEIKQCQTLSGHLKTKIKHKFFIGHTLI